MYDTRTQYKSNLSVGEVIKMVIAEKSKKGKQEILRKHNSNALMQIIKLNYDKSCNVDIDFNRFNYIKSEKEETFGDATLHSASKRMYIFFDENSVAPKGVKMAPEKRMAFFRTLLESLDKVESQFLFDACQKQLKLNMTYEEITAVYPNLIAERLK